MPLCLLLIVCCRMQKSYALPLSLSLLLLILRFRVRASYALPEVAILLFVLVLLLIVRSRVRTCHAEVAMPKSLLLVVRCRERVPALAEGAKFRLFLMLLPPLLSLLPLMFLMRLRDRARTSPVPLVTAKCLSIPTLLLN